MFTIPHDSHLIYSHTLDLPEGTLLKKLQSHHDIEFTQRDEYQIKTSEKKNWVKLAFPRNGSYHDHDKVVVTFNLNEGNVKIDNFGSNDPGIKNARSRLYRRLEQMKFTPEDDITTTREFSSLVLAYKNAKPQLQLSEDLWKAIDDDGRRFLVEDPSKPNMRRVASSGSAAQSSSIGAILADSFDTIRKFSDFGKAKPEILLPISAVDPTALMTTVKNMQSREMAENDALLMMSNILDIRMNPPSYEENLSQGRDRQRNNWQGRTADSKTGVKHEI